MKLACLLALAGLAVTAVEAQTSATDQRAKLPAEETPGAQSPAKQPGLRLEELEKMALANNPAMAQAQANAQAAAGLARQSGLYPNPTVGYYGDEIRGGYSGGGKQGAFASQTIVLGGKLGAARRVADLETKQAEAGAEIQRLRILTNVRTLFYQTLAAQRLVEVRVRLVNLATDAVETSHQLANIGKSDRPDLLQAEVEQQQARVSLGVSQQDLRSWWRMLAAAAGRSELPAVKLEGDLEGIPDLRYDEWIAAASRDSPAMKLALQAVERAEASLAQARKAPVPDLQISGILAQNYEPVDTTRKPTGLVGGAQIGIQLPIFNRNQGNIAAAKAEIEVAKRDAERIRLQLQRSLAGIFRDYDAAQLTVKQYKSEMLPRANEAYRLYLANYQNMAGPYAPVLLAQRTLFQLEGDYIHALAAAWQSAIMIRGFGLTDGLAAPMSTSATSAGVYGPAAAMRAAPLQ